MNSVLCHLCLLIIIYAVVGRLEPTKLVNNGIFTLMNQNDGRYLTEGTNGNPTNAEYNGTKNQKFTFKKVSEAGDEWMLVSLSTGNPLSSTSWKIAYVGHGKYQFTNIKTGTCLQGTGTAEGICGKSNPLQRWFVAPLTN